MPRNSKARCLDVWMNGELVGHWKVDSQAQHEFRYDKDWVKNEGARPISLSMPLQPPEVPYRGAEVESYFDHLLAESIDVRKRVRDRFGASTTRAFDLLIEIGRDCIGAVQLLPPDQPPRDVEQINGEILYETGVASSLRAAVSGAPLGQREEDLFRISIAGMQEKTALLLHEGEWHEPLGATPTTHIFKLPLGRVGNMQADLSTSVENEWLCARIVRQFGLPIANCEIADFEDQHALVVERFDRRLSTDKSWWLRLPQEDMCQATGTPPANKYEVDDGPGISEISNLLQGSQNARVDRRIFFRAQVLYWMLCAVNGHAKNYSVFIERYGRYRLTPLYDVISAYPILGNRKNQLAPRKAVMAMALSGRNQHYKWAEIQPRHWLSTANKVGLNATVEEDIADLVAKTPEVIRAVDAILPYNFPREVAEPIFAGLVSSAKKLANLA